MIKSVQANWPWPLAICYQNGMRIMITDSTRKKKTETNFTYYEIKHLLLIDMHHHFYQSIHFSFLNVWLTCILTLITAQH